MKYKYNIAGIVYVDETEIIGWEDMTTTIKRAKGGILITQDVKLRFKGAPYKHLYSAFFGEGYCTELETVIHESCDEGATWNKIHTGLIKNSAITINETNCIAEAIVFDDSYYARINNNRSIETAFAGKTKNGETIPTPTQQNLKMFNPADGSPALVDNVPAYRVHDVLKYMVSFMSDDGVDFLTDHLNAGTFKNLCVTNGYALRTGLLSPDHPLIFQFGKTFDETHKKLNISFNIEDGAKPVFRLENKPFFYQDTVVAELTDVNEIIIKTKNQEIYSQIQLGSDDTDKAVELHFPDDISYEGFKDEKFFLLGQCNDLDNILNLKSTWIIASNIIEKLVMKFEDDGTGVLISDAGNDGDDSFDDEIFLISCEETPYISGQFLPTKTNWLAATPPYFYNAELRNSQCVNRYLGFIPNSIAGYFGVATNRFKAIKTTDEEWTDTTIPVPPTGEIETPVSFENDSTGGAFDDGNNYSNSIYEYTCPFGGVYSFNQFFTYTQAGLYNFPDNWFSFTLMFKRYDSGGVAGGVLLQTLTATTTTHPSNGTFTKSFSGTMNCNAGDVVVVSVQIVLDGSFTLPLHQSFKMLAGSYFECTDAITGADGVVATSDPNDYKIIQVDFTHPINSALFRTIKANPKGKFKITSNGRSRLAWIDVMQHKHQTTMTTCSLITSINVNL